MKKNVTDFTTRDIDQLDQKPQIENLIQEAKQQQSKLTQKKMNGKFNNATTLNLNTTYYKDINEKIKKLQIPLWNASAASWTRNSSPNYNVAKSPRFSSIEEDKLKNTQFLRLNLRKQLEANISFPKSVRKDYFYDKKKTGFPSPASYNAHRFLDNSLNKIAQINLQKKPSKAMQKNLLNPENQLNDSLHYINHSNHQVKEYRFDQLKGRSFYRAKNHQKLYLDHGKNLPYHEIITERNAQIGLYELRQVIGKQKPQYSMRKVLNRFNQKISNTPGPSDYKTNQKQDRERLITKKGTFTFGDRLDLGKPLNQTPGPGGYTITRYLEGKK